MKTRQYTSDDLLRDVIRENLRSKMTLNEALLTEDLDGDSVKDAIQFVVSAGAEYGLGALTLPAAGAGLAVGPTVETMVDSAFAAEEIASGVQAVKGISGKLKEYGSLWDEAVAAYSGNLESYYKKLVEIVQKILADLGEKAEDTVDDLAEKLKGAVENIISAIVDTLSSGIKLIIPDAALGTAAALAFEEALEALSESAYSMVTKAVNKVKMLKDFVSDPSIAVDFFKDVFAQVVEMMRKTAELMEDPEDEDAGMFKKVAKMAIKGAVPGLMAFDIAKKVGSAGLVKAADIIEKQLPSILKVIDGVLTVLVPYTITALGLFQILMKGEYKKEEEDEATADTKSESVLRSLVRQLLKEDPMGFVHDLAASDKFGEDFFGGNVGKEAGREIKRAFNKNADHQFLSTLDTVHWGTTYGIESLVGNKGKDELSATMSLPGDSFVPAAGLEVGLWIKGRITLATNDQDKMYSGFQGDYGPGAEGTEEEVAHRDKSSGRNKRPTVSKSYKNYGKLQRGNEYMEKMARDGIPYVLDQSTWKGSEGGWGTVNEALVDNWKPAGIIVGTSNNLINAVKAYDDIDPEDIDIIGAGATKKIFEMAIKFGVPIYDTERNKLWAPE